MSFFHRTDSEISASVAWLVFFVLPRRARNLVLAGSVCCSACGAAMGAPPCCWSLCCSTGWPAWPCPGGPGRKPLLAACVAVDLAVLGVFKYAGFVTQNLDALLPGLVPVVSIALPLGLSFYTFQGISYCVDVARGDTPPERNPVRFFLYMAFFAMWSRGPSCATATRPPCWTPPARPGGSRWTASARHQAVHAGSGQKGAAG